MLLLYWLYCLAFAFDFRGDEGGSSVQYLFLAVALSTGSTIIWSGRRTLFATPSGYLVLAWLAYLASTPVVALSNHVSIGNFIRSAIPVILCGFSMLVMQAMAGFGFRPKALLNPLLLSGSISIIWRAFYALVIKGIAIDQIRYELLSPAAPLFIAYFIAALFFSRQRFAWEAFTVGAIAFGSLFISVTRSYIVTAGVAFLACVGLLLLSLRWRQWTAADLGRKFARTASILAVAGALCVSIAVANPAILERWTGRLFENAGTGKETSVDITLLTRMAEAASMMRILHDNPDHYLHGMGMGHAYHWDESYAQELLLVYPDRNTTAEDFYFPGHSTWVYALFSGGAIGFCAFLVLMLGSLAIGFGSCRLYALCGYPANDVVYLPFVIHLCYLSQSFTANPFGDRYAGLIIGLMAMLPQAVYNALRHEAAVPAARGMASIPSIQRA